MQTIRFTSSIWTLSHCASSSPELSLVFFVGIFVGNGVGFGVVGILVGLVVELDVGFSVGWATEPLKTHILSLVKVQCVGTFLHLLRLFE